MESPIKDTLNKEHFLTHYSGILSLKEDNLSIVEEMIYPVLFN